jgi:CRP/FNR family cyclic AMP-dependent transcriptional regulator
MTTKNPSPDMLKDIRIFHGLSPDDLSKLAKIMTYEKRPTASQLVREAQKASEVFFIINGRVRIEMARLQEGSPELLTTLGSGDTVGELALARNGRRTASALTQTDSELCVCDANELNSVFDKHPEIGLRVFRNLTNVIADRLGDMNFMVRNTSK